MALVTFSHYVGNDRVSQFPIHSFYYPWCHLVLPWKRVVINEEFTRKAGNKINTYSNIGECSDGKNQILKAPKRGQDRRKISPLIISSKGTHDYELCSSNVRRNFFIIIIFHFLLWEMVHLNVMSAIRPKTDSIKLCIMSNITYFQENYQTHCRNIIPLISCYSTQWNNL